MHEKKKQKRTVIAYCRVGTKEQIDNPNAKYMKEWTKMCQAYCDKIDAKLLFVNQNHFGCEMPDGELRRICADELAVLAATKQLFSVKLSGAKMKMWSTSCE